MLNVFYFRLNWLHDFYKCMVSILGYVRVFTKSLMCNKFINIGDKGSSPTINHYTVTWLFQLKVNCEDGSL
jgi:hypothetical protein